MAAPTARYYFAPGYTWKTADASIVWVEITDRVLSERGTYVNRGRSSELDDYRAGTASFTLDNRGRLFDPSYTSGTYYGDLKPGVPVKIEAVANSTTFPVFRGFIEGWPQDYELSDNLPVVNITAVDGFGNLATAALPSSVYALEVAADSPTAWWRLSETVGEVMGDSSGNRHHGRFYNSATQFSGRHPGSYETVPAIVHDGSLRPGEVTPATAILTGRPMTIELVFQVPLVHEQADAILATIFHFVTPSLRIDIRLQVHNGVNPTWDFYAYGTVTGGSNGSVGVEGLPIDGSVQHLIYRWPAASSAAVRLNGVTYATIVSDLTLGTNNSVVVGAGAVEDSLNRRYFGPLADVIVWNSDIGTTRAAVHEDAFTAPWDGDSTGERIQRVLTAVGWPSDLVDIDTGYTTLGPAVLGTNALPLIKGFERAEQGRFFIAADGTATFLDRYNSVTSTPGSVVQATLSDDGSDIPYSGLGFDFDSRLIKNRIRGSRVGGAEVEVLDETSQDEYGDREDSSLSDIQVPTDDVVRSAAEWRLARYKDPQMRARPVSVKLHGITAAQQATMLGLELAYRINIERTPNDTGSAIDQETLIEGLSHSIGAGEWTTTITSSPVDLIDVFILDDSLLDGDAVLGY